MIFFLLSFHLDLKHLANWISNLCSWGSAPKYLSFYLLMPQFERIKLNASLEKVFFQTHANEILNRATSEFLWFRSFSFRGVSPSNLWVAKLEPEFKLPDLKKWRQFFVRIQQKKIVTNLSLARCLGWGGCIAQRLRSRFLPSGPGFESQLCRDIFSRFFSTALFVDSRDRTHLVLKPNRFHKCSAMKAWAKYYKKILCGVLRRLLHFSTSWHCTCRRPNRMLQPNHGRLWNKGAVTASECSWA